MFERIVTVRACIYIYIIILYTHNILGTNNLYKNINLGRQTFNDKPLLFKYLQM